MMDTDALWQAIAAYGNARWRGVKFEQDAADHLSEIKRLLNEADEEHKSLLADNERLVVEVAELKSAYESQFKELHELKAKLTKKAELLDALKQCLGMLEHADCSTGYCCCGSPMDGHSIGDGHSQVDQGAYYQCSAMDSARAAIAKVQGEEA